MFVEASRYINSIIILVAALFWAAAVAAESTAEKVATKPPLQQTLQILGHWKLVGLEIPEPEVISEKESIKAGDNQEQKELPEDIWTFNKDASFLSRIQGHKKGDAHYALRLQYLEISQPGLREQYTVLMLNETQLQLLRLEDQARLSFERSAAPAGQGPRSLYYSPRQVATMKVLLTCGYLDNEQMNNIYAADLNTELNVEQKNDKKVDSIADDKKEAIAKKNASKVQPVTDATVVNGQALYEPYLSPPSLAMRERWDRFIYEKTGIAQFNLKIYQASSNYYESNARYLAVFPSLIRRGIRRCLD